MRFLTYSRNIYLKGLLYISYTFDLCFSFAFDSRFGSGFSLILAFILTLILASILASVLARKCTYPGSVHTWEVYMVDLLCIKTCSLIRSGPFPRPIPHLVGLFLIHGLAIT